MKLNVDASFHLDAGKGVIGAVIGDSSGHFLAASTTFVHYASSAVAMEALAMQHGLALVLNCGCNSIVAESDNTEVIDACSRRHQWYDPVAATYAQCMETAGAIGKVEFRHVHREANGVAHELARMCFLDEFPCNWIDEPPSFILSALMNDVSVFCLSIKCAMMAFPKRNTLFI